MYYRHFGLDGPPFEFSASPASLYLGHEHREALAALEWGLLREPSGYTLFVGEPGTGKTTLVCAVLAHHHEEVRAVYLNHPKLAFDDLLLLITRQLGIEPEQPGKLVCLEAFKRFLDELKPNTRVVVIIDEAQGVSTECFEELRLLSNHGRRDEHQVQLILVGQPELLDRLQTRELRQLGERIGARAVLHPLTPDEVYRYIEQRLQLRGGHARNIFARRALALVVERSRGIPRRVNILCHNAMLTAFAQGSRRVTRAIMRAAVAEYDAVAAAPPVRSARMAVSSRTTPARWAAALAALGALALLALGGTLLWTRGERLAIGPVIDGGPLAAIVPALPAAVGATAAMAAPNKPAELPQNASPPVRAPIMPAVAAPAPTAPVAPPPANAAAAGRRQVRVASGDTAEGLALRYYGTRTAVRDIRQENPQIADLSHIYPGETIYLPVEAIDSPASSRGGN